MTPPTYTIRVAGEADVPAVVALRRHAEGWLRAAGIEQWTSSEHGDRVIKGWIGAGSTFVIEDNSGEVIGTLALDKGDPDFWTPAEINEPAIHLYKFILRSEHRGNGLGDLLLDWACCRAELAGALWLRLDCWRNNTKLHEYYLRRGFRRYDTRTHPTRMSGAMFERPAELRLVTHARVRLVDETHGGAVFPDEQATLGGVVPHVPLSQDAH